MDDARAAPVDAGTDERECEWDGCATRHASDQALYQHLVHAHDVPSNHLDGKLICRWAGCSVTTGKSACRGKHLITHTEYRPYVCTIPGCSKAFNLLGTLEHHLRYANHRKLIPAEPESPSGSTAPWPASPAAAATERSSTTVRCRWKGCPEVLQDPDALLAHLRAEHEAPGVDCEWARCKRPSALQGNSLLHLQTHLPKWHRPVACDKPGCSKTFAQHGHMRIHVSSAHPELFVATGKKRKRAGGESARSEKEAGPSKRQSIAHGDGNEDESEADDDGMDIDPSLRSLPSAEAETAATSPEPATKPEDPCFASLVVAAIEGVEARLTAAVKRIEGLEQQLAVALGVISQSAVLRTEWEQRAAEDASAVTVKGATLSGALDVGHEQLATQRMDVETSANPEAPTLDEWTRWVMGDADGENAVP